MVIAFAYGVLVNWSGKHGCFHVDNLAAVSAAVKRSSKELSLTGILLCISSLRYLSFFSAHFQFSFTSVYIPGFCNVTTNKISHNRLSHLSSQILSVQSEPSPIPSSLWSLLVLFRPD